MRKLLLVTGIVVLLLTGVACSDDEGGGDGTPSDGSGATADGGDATGTLRVPEDYDTIQAAVDDAAPGALILVGEGTYHEAVDVATNDLVIRGIDRNKVVLDGEHELQNGIRVLSADGVAIENMTAQNYTGNGFFWTTDIDGYRASYLTAIRNGDYGVYAFGARNGVIEHSYASGSPDAGFYIGQCYPCNTLIDNVVSEFNGLGYSGTNSGGDLTIVRSTFRFNRAGIVPNSGSYEGCAPQRETTVVGNLVYSNSNAETSAIDAAILAQGNGIITTGGVSNVIERNRVWDHDIGGITLAPFPEEGPNAPIPVEPPTDCLEAGALAADEVVEQLPDTLFWPARLNVVRGNAVSESRVADLILVANAADENRYCDNEVSSSLPADLESLAPCEGVLADLGQEALTRFLEIIEVGNPPSVDYQTVELPDPGELPGMADPETAPPSPARDLAYQVDLATIALPARP